MRPYCFATLASSHILLLISLVNAVSLPPKGRHAVMPEHHRRAPLSVRDNATTELRLDGPTVEGIYQFPNNTWLENLAVRSNGQVLVTVMTTPDLYLIDPNKPQPILVHSFTDHLGLLGIAELRHDDFYVIAGNYSQPTNTNTPGAWDVYNVNMGVHPPAVKLSAHFPNAILLNGMAVLNASEGLLLIGDAGAGVVYSLSADTGAIKVVIDDPTMKPPSGDPVGIDGVQIFDNTLYYTNPYQQSLFKIPLHADGTAASSAELVATGWEVDDFAFDNVGNGYMAISFSDEIGQVQNPGANMSIVAGSPSQLVGPTACKFGRMPQDKDMLYVTTTGGLGIGDASVKPGGMLSRVDMTGVTG